MLLPTLLTLIALAGPLEPPPLPGEPLGTWHALAASAPVDPLTAEEAVRIAVAANGDLAASRAEVDRARGARLAARALPNPSAELGLVDDGALGLTRVEVEYPLSDAALAPLRARPVGLALDRAGLDATAEQVRLGFEVRRAVYAAQAAEQRVAAAMRALDALAAAVETSRALFAAGNVPELDVAVQESAYELARVGLAAQELELLVARESLSRLLGGEERRPLAPLPSASSLELPDDLEARAVAASLELQALDRQVNGSTAALTAARVDAALPGLGVFAGTERAGAGWAIEAGLHVSVPLFQLGRGPIAQAAAERDGLAATRAQREVDVRSAAREARARLVSAHDRAVHFETVVLPARVRVSRQTLLQYNAMQVGVYALLDALRAELDTRAALAELLAERWTAQAALDALLAGVRVDAPAAVSTPTSSAAPAAGGH